jgi:hypothetical protein
VPNSTSPRLGLPGLIGIRERLDFRFEAGGALGKFAREPRQPDGRLDAAPLHARKHRHQRALNVS